MKFAGYISLAFMLFGVFLLYIGTESQLFGTGSFLFTQGSDLGSTSVREPLGIDIEEIDNLVFKTQGNEEKQLMYMEPTLDQRIYPGTIFEGNLIHSEQNMGESLSIEAYMLQDDGVPLYIASSTIEDDTVTYQIKTLTAQGVATVYQTTFEATEVSSLGIGLSDTSHIIFSNGSRMWTTDQQMPSEFFIAIRSQGTSLGLEDLNINAL